MRFKNNTTQTVRPKVFRSGSAGHYAEAGPASIAPHQAVDINLNDGTYVVEAYVGDAAIPAAVLNDVPSDSYVRLTLGNEYDLNIVPEQEIGPNC
jgi:hypothetical protein